jgi:hypothetical protein
MLQVEPYSLSIPEHERRPIFFMLDRNEAARAGISGYKFQAVTRDTTQGGAAVIPRLLAREGLAESAQDAWIRSVVRLLLKNEILVTPAHLPPRVRNAIGTGRPMQVAARVLRLVPRRPVTGAGSATSGVRIKGMPATATGAPGPGSICCLREPIRNSTMSGYTHEKPEKIDRGRAYRTDWPGSAGGEREGFQER